MSHLQYFMINLFLTDLENDKIRITCDDDLKFFIEESPCHKIIFNFGPESELESSRKRTCSEASDDVESSKRIRRQFQQIDLSSDSSAMETDDDEEPSMSSSADNSRNESAQIIDQIPSTSAANVTQAIFDKPIPSTSAASQFKTPESPNVQVLSVEIIKAVDEPETIELTNDHESEVQAVVSNPVTDEIARSDEQHQQSTSEDSSRKKPDTNRIVISDSSDEEATQEPINNRRHSDGPFSSAYSFTNVNGNGFESRSSFSGGCHSNSYRFRRGPRGHHYHSFREQSSDFQRRQAENMDRIRERTRQYSEQTREFQRRHAESMIRLQEGVQESVRQARDHATRAVRASTSAIPAMISTFQSHFRPLFHVADINQNIFGSGRR